MSDEFYAEDLDEIKEDDLTKATFIRGDEEIDNPLRPNTLDEYIGQDKVKENLKVFIEAAKKRQEQLDHVLLYGPPGLGKTTLSNIIAHELGVGIRITSGPAIERAGDLAAILSSLAPNDVLFIDEIHRLNRAVEEIMYPAMEDFTIDIVTGKGQMAQTFHIPLPKFTLIGATTRTGQLSAPLRDRFGVVERLELYTPKELALIVSRSSKILGIDIESEASYEIARRSRGTPRIANRLLKRVRDFATVSDKSVISKNIASDALFRLDIDDLGLDSNDRRFLRCIIDSYDGGPVGLKTIASAIGEEEITLEDAVEPYLMQLGFISRTTKGRVATRLAYEHLGINTKPKNNQGSFFA